MPCLYRVARGSRTNFGRFLRSTYKRMGLSVLPSAELLPCPIPFPWEHAPTSGGSRRRSRFKRRRALELMVNLQVCALNFCFLGSPSACPVRGRRGELSRDQRSMVQSLWDRNCSMCRLAGDLTAGCGSKLFYVQSELDSFSQTFESLRELVYGTAKQRTFSPTMGTNTRTEVVPLVASKVAFPENLFIRAI